MSGRRLRHQQPVDVYLILRRDGAAGPEVLMSRRAGDVYAAGLRHCPSEHYDGPHEDVVAALIREAEEETGVSIKPADVRFARLAHHRVPGGGVRVGMFRLPSPLRPVRTPRSVRSHRAHVSERDFRDWYRECDLLPERVETVIGADSSPTDTVGRIMRDTGLEKLPGHTT